MTLARDARLWAQKWRWYERNSLPWNRARIHWEFMRREAFVRWPVHGNVLEALREGRLEVGPGTLFEPDVWITAPGDARVRIGAGTFLNLGVMVAAQGLVEIGDHCMLANGCFVSDASHRHDDPAEADHVAGVRERGADAHRGQLLAGRERGGDERREHRRALRDRREQRGHARRRAVLGGRRRPCADDQEAGARPGRRGGRPRRRRRRPARRVACPPGIDIIRG